MAFENCFVFFRSFFSLGIFELTFMVARVLDGRSFELVNFFMGSGKLVVGSDY